jgi:hypothetical protein
MLEVQVKWLGIDQSSRISQKSEESMGINSKIGHFRQSKISSENAPVATSQHLVSSTQLGQEAKIIIF